MSKYTLNFENIPKSFIKKKNNNFLSPSISIKPQFQWLQNYLKTAGQKCEKTNPGQTQRQRPNLSKKILTRRLLRTKNKIVPMNQNRDILNEPKFGIISKQTIVKNIQTSDLQTIKSDNHQRRHSCQLFRSNNPNINANGNLSRQIKNHYSRQGLPKMKKSQKQNCFNSILEPWESQQLKTQIIEHDIIGYMFHRQFEKQQ